MTVALVMTMSGKVHRSDCGRSKHVYKIVGPEIPDEEVVEFIRVRKFDACFSCFPELREQNR